MLSKHIQNEEPSDQLNDIDLMVDSVDTLRSYLIVFPIKSFKKRCPSQIDFACFLAWKLFQENFLNQEGIKKFYVPNRHEGISDHENEPDKAPNIWYAIVQLVDGSLVNYGVQGSLVI